MSREISTSCRFIHKEKGNSDIPECPSLNTAIIQLYNHNRLVYNCQFTNYIIITKLTQSTAPRSRLTDKTKTEVGSPDLLLQHLPQPQNILRPEEQ